MYLNGIFHECQSVSGSRPVLATGTPESFLEYAFSFLWRYGRAGAEHIVLDPGLIRAKAAFKIFSSIGHVFFLLPLIGNDFLSIFQGVGKKVAIDLGHQTNINDSGRLFFRKIAVPFNDLHASFGEAFHESFKLRSNHNLFHIAAGSV